MRLTVLNVAYPLAPVGSDAVGGSEQILSSLDEALVQAGHRSIVIACDGSRAAGILLKVPAQRGILDGSVIAASWEPHRHAIAEALARYEVDVVHLHGFDYHAYLPPPGVPVLATLHLPPSWYPEHALLPERPGTWLNCVSQTQHETCPKSPMLLPPIENGVPIAQLQARHSRRNFALMIGRICPEKGVHHAIDAAKQAGANLLIGGEVFHYEDHDRYFVQEIKPRLDKRRRLVGRLNFSCKRRLLNSARCLLVPSLAPETSSLVAMEAMACGTPVIAFANGALPEMVAHGQTGFLVRDTVEMAHAIGMAGKINPETCRKIARNRFSVDMMVERYFDLYRRLAVGSNELARRQAAVSEMDAV